MSLSNDVVPHRGATSHGRRYLVIVALFLAAAVALLWGWNEVAASLFGAPVLQFRHVLAPLLALMLVVALLRAVWQRDDGGAGLPGR